MPRARVPHVSLIARADLPILPFLAPRAFAEFPWPQRQNGERDGVQKEEKKVTTLEEKSKWKERGQAASSNDGLNAYLRRRNESTTTALLRDSGARWNGATKRVQPRHIDSVYVDACSIALQQTRCYITAKSATRVVTRRKRPIFRGDERKSDMSVAGTIGKINRPDRDRKASPIRTLSVLAPHGPRLAAQRAKALAVEQQRLSEFVSRLKPDLSATQRLQKGQYRSLCRRIYNLHSWDATQIILRNGANRTSWLIRAFAALDRAIYPSIGRHTRKIVLQHDPRCARWSRSLFQVGKKVGSHQIWTVWMGLGVSMRTKAFRKILLYLLDRKPGRALRFIQVIANDPLLRNSKTEIIADALGHLSKIHSTKIYTPRKEWGQDEKANVRSFVPAFVHIFNNSLAGIPDVCSQDLLYNLVGLATTLDLKKVFDCLVAARTRFSFDTLLHYANAFGKASEVHYALRCLQELKLRHGPIAWQSAADRVRLRWTCALILRKSISEGQNYHETPRIVAAFVELGIKMDILLYNVVMHNAMEAGDHATAFKVYDTLESNGLKADKHTFSILLHGCTSQSNPAMFHTFAQHCADVARKTGDPWLATDYLYHLYVRHQNDSDPDYRARVLWQVYLSHFSVSLELFARPEIAHMKSYMDTQSPGLNSAALEPTPVALYIMLQTEIELALAVSDQRVLNLYQRFKMLANTPRVKTLVQDPTMWNAFLLAFCQKQQFASASQLITDMMNSSPQPNVYSWNIFMQAFFKTGQVQAAERVFEIMRHKGIEPDQFGYGVMLRGYANAQLVERLGETMQHVDSKQEMDPELLRALAQIVNRKQLMTTLEKSQIVKERKAQEEADRDAKEEQERWTEVEFVAAPSDRPLLSASPDLDSDAEPGTFDMPQRQDSPNTPQALTNDHEQMEILPDMEQDSFLDEPPAAPQNSLYVSQESPILSENHQATTQHREVGAPVSEAQVTTAMEEEADDEVFTFLESPASSSDEIPPPPGPHTSQLPAPPPPPPTSTPHHEPRNPKAQFRELQHKLNTDAGAPSMRSFGANLGFKSMLASDKKESAEAARDLASLDGEVSFGSMLSERLRVAGGGDGKLVGTRVRKIALRDKEDMTNVTNAKDKTPVEDTDANESIVTAKEKKAKKKTHEVQSRRDSRW